MGTACSGFPAMTRSLARCNSSDEGVAWAQMVAAHSKPAQIRQEIAAIRGRRIGREIEDLRLKIMPACVGSAARVSSCGTSPTYPLPFLRHLRMQVVQKPIQIIGGPAVRIWTLLSVRGSQRL